MTESEILEELALVNAAIRRILQLGVEYELDSASSKRRTRDSELSELRKQRAYLNQELQEIQGNSGVITSF